MYDFKKLKDEFTKQDINIFNIDSHIIINEQDFRLVDFFDLIQNDMQVFSNCDLYDLKLYEAWLEGSVERGKKR